MSVLLLYSVTLLAAVLLSDLAHRTVLSTAVLFLAVGIAASATGVLHMQESDSAVQELAELALISVLFTDGLKVGARDVLEAWRLPGRALLVGLPLTVVGTAIVAVAVARISWPAALLVGAALSPTDPVFAAALIGSERVPMRLRRLLNIESSLNDGVALPILLGVLAWMGAGHAKMHLAVLQLLMGAAIGVAIPWSANFLERRSWLGSSEQYEPILPVAVVALVFSVSELVHANEFIATAVAGVTLATVAPGVSKRFSEIGEWVSELLKLAALLIFGGFFSLHVWREVGWSGIVFAVLALALVRPVALAIALWRTALPMRERVAVAWFGPKGFASVLFGLLILRTELPRAHYYFELIALTIVSSIVAHSSTDILVARWFEPAAAGEEEGREARV